MAEVGNRAMDGLSMWNLLEALVRDMSYRDMYRIVRSVISKPFKPFCGPLFSKKKIKKKNTDRIKSPFGLHLPETLSQAFFKNHSLSSAFKRSSKRELQEVFKGRCQADYISSIYLRSLALLDALKSNFTF